jgi:hypothetical protein
MELFSYYVLAQQPKDKSQNKQEKEKEKPNKYMQTQTKDSESNSHYSDIKKKLDHSMTITPIIM